MCTHFVFVNSRGTVTLANQLGVDAQAFLYSDAFRPGSPISVIFQVGTARVVRPAIWWLFLQQTGQGLKPHPDYFSVNTRWSKLPQRPEFKKTRCLIPATAFVESQDGKHPHVLAPADGSALAFGGLYKEWVDRTTGEVMYSASIITLKGHPALADIHRKSMPLWLPETAFEAWLNPQNTDTACFNTLLEPELRTALKATPIDKVMLKNPVGASFVIEP